MHAFKIKLNSNDALGICSRGELRHDFQYAFSPLYIFEILYYIVVELLPSQEAQ